MGGQWIWEPSPAFIESTNVYRFMRWLGFTEREPFLEFSREQNEVFWAEWVREAGIEWFHPFEKTLDLSRGVEWARWFSGGKLNIAWNCLDRHAKTGAIACVWESEDGSSRQLNLAEL